MRPCPPPPNIIDRDDAYLLGQQVERGEDSILQSLVLLTKNAETGEVEYDDERVYAFLWHVIETEDAQGEHCGSEAFQHAFQLAMWRMGDCLDMPLYGSSEKTKKPDETASKKKALLEDEEEIRR